MPEYIEREAAVNAVRNVWLGVEAINKIPAADVVDVETVKAWLYAIAMNNVGVKAGDVASVCEDIAERMDGLRAFARKKLTEMEGKSDAN